MSEPVLNNFLAVIKVVGVGGAGGNAVTTNYGGGAGNPNGGDPGYTGGGATHIATSSGTLSSLSGNQNAVLIVEFAVHKRRQGMSVLDAAIEGAKVRFRPILMTSFAFVAGLIPLVMAHGAGAIGNRTIGTSAMEECS